MCGTKPNTNLQRNIHNIRLIKVNNAVAIHFILICAAIQFEIKQNTSKIKVVNQNIALHIQFRKRAHWWRIGSYTRVVFKRRISSSESLKFNLKFIQLLFYILQLKRYFVKLLLSLTTDAKSGLGVLVSRRRRGEQGDPERAGAGDAPRDPPCLRTAKS